MQLQGIFVTDVAYKQLINRVLHLLLLIKTIYVMDFPDFEDVPEGLSAVCAVIGAITAPIIYCVYADQILLGELLLMLPLGAIIGGIVGYLIFLGITIILYVLALGLAFYVIYLIFSFLSFLYNLVLWEK